MRAIFILCLWTSAVAAAPSPGDIGTPEHTKAADLVKPTHRFEMGIEEQAAALMNDGLSYSGHPQLNVFATFGAFLEGIAREGFPRGL